MRLHSRTSTLQCVKPNPVEDEILNCNQIGMQRSDVSERKVNEISPSFAMSPGSSFIDRTDGIAGCPTNQH